MNETRRITEHQSSPFITSPIISPEERQRAREEHERSVEPLRKEAVEREMAYICALNGPPRPRIEAQQPPPLKAPVLAQDFDALAIDEKIVERGIALNRDRLLTLGRERFEDLLLLDGRARQSQRIIGSATDLTSWARVAFAFQSVRSFDVAAVPPRKTAEIAAGAGKDREEARMIVGFVDLWKLFEQEPSTVRSLYAFHDAFARLMLGASMLERLSKDGRLRSRFFCGGHGEKVRWFNGWLSVLQGPHFKVTIERPLAAVMTWLCAERTPLPEPKEQARAWYGVRSVEPFQIKLVEAVIEGFLLDFREWSLWEHVGRRTRQTLHVDRLEQWRKELCRRFPAIWQFHQTVRPFFMRQVGNLPYGGHLEFDSARHRAYLKGELNKLLDAVSLVAAQETQGACVARFSESLLCEGKPKDSLADKIGAKLKAAFRGSNFNVQLEAITQ